MQKPKKFYDELSVSAAENEPTHGFSGTFKLIWSYIITDIQKKARSFKIGVFSIFLVVCFLTLLQSLIQLSPVFFIRLSEISVGDADLVMTPISPQNDTRLTDQNFDSQAIVRLLNTSDIGSRLENYGAIQGISPRWILPAQIMNPEDTKRVIPGFALIIDSEREELIGLGKNLRVPTLNHSDCWLSKGSHLLIGLKGENLG